MRSESVSLRRPCSWRRRMRFSVARYSFWSMSCSSTEPVMKANNLFQVIGPRLPSGSWDRHHHVNPYSQVNWRFLTLRDSWRDTLVQFALELFGLSLSRGLVREQLPLMLPKVVVVADRVVVATFVRGIAHPDRPLGHQLQRCKLFLFAAIICWHSQ